MSNTPETPLPRLYLITYVNTFIKSFILFSRVYKLFWNSRENLVTVCACAKERKKSRFYDLLDK